MTAPWILVAGWLIGPAAWAVHLMASYVMVPWVCGSGEHWTLHLVTLLTALAALGGGVLGWRQWRAAARQRADSRSRTTARFMGVSGLAINVVSALIIIAEGLPNFVLSACL